MWSALILSLLQCIDSVSCRAMILSLIWLHWQRLENLLIQLKSEYDQGEKAWITIVLERRFAFNNSPLTNIYSTSI